MEQRLANTWRMAVNEKKFIEKALLSDLRVDGRGPFDYRKLNIKFGREDGSSEVQLGQTHVMGFVTSQLAQPYRDRPNEGSLSVFTEFSPMADPSFEPGRPGESAVELGRIIDRGLRESKAVDTESLCVLAGKLVWAIRIDIHILDNGGNLVDAANIAALAALMTFRRPECTLGGENGQEVIVHPPEEREPLPLIIHHLPIAVTFAFFRNESSMAIDPTHFEEAVMSGRMTATLNTNGDICAIQKAGGEGVLQSVIMQCLRIASVKAADITTKIRKAVEAYCVERQLRKIKRHNSSVAVDVSAGTSQNRPISQKVIGALSGPDLEIQSPDQGDNSTRDCESRNFTGGSSSWDSSSTGVDPDRPEASIASRGLTSDSSQKDSGSEKKQSEAKAGELGEDTISTSSVIDAHGTRPQNNGDETIKDALKPKNRRKKK